MKLCPGTGRTAIGGGSLGMMKYLTCPVCRTSLPVADDGTTIPKHPKEK